jgi:hypothetical protein
LWGIYTTYAALGTALAGKALPTWAILVIASPSAALIAVYWGAVWVQAPVPVEFDPRSPDMIRGAFGRILDERQRRLSLTIIGSIAAAFLVASAVVLMSTVKEQKPAVPSLAAAIVSSSAGREVAVTAMVDTKAEAKLRLELIAPRQDKVVETEKVVLPTESGLVQTSVGIDPSTEALLVSLEWKGRDGLTWTLTREARQQPTE